MAVYTYLDLSTAHVTKHDTELLDNNLGPIGWKYPEGYFIHVPPDNDDMIELIINMEKQGFSPDIIRLLFVAHKSNHQLIRLDADADILEEFPTHEW